MTDQLSCAASTIGSGRSIENPEMHSIREALGAIAMAAPAVFWLYHGEDGDWHVRREGDPDDRSFSSREAALKALRLAAVRCMSYCLFLQDITGRFEQEFFNWLPNQSRRG